MLLQENGDLGKMISSGRTARLEGEIALHKALVAEMKTNQKGRSYYYLLEKPLIRHVHFLLFQYFSSNVKSYLSSKLKFYCWISAGNGSLS